jgi:hypothetical protein
VLLERGDLLVREDGVERGGGVGEVVRWCGLVAPTMGAATTGLRSTQAIVTWAIEMPRAAAMACTASTVPLSLSRKSAVPTESVAGLVAPRVVLGCTGPAWR